MEIPETRFSLMQWWRLKLGRPPREENPTSWRTPLASVGLLLVIVGVLGEVVFEGLASNADARLRAHESEILSDAETQAGSANERASQAEATAKGFDAQIAESNAKAKSAEATAKQFEAQIVKAQRDAAESKKEAESERLARVTLQHGLQPRRLTGEQKKKLATLLSDTPVPIGILYNPIFSECTDFANDIGESLNNAGWKMVMIPGFNSEHGVEIGTTKESDMTLLTPFMQKLKNSLLTVGVTSRITFFDRKNRGTSTELDKNALYLAIDNKPEIAPTQ